MGTFPLERRNRLLDLHNAATLARFARETSTEPSKGARGATPAGDERKLRGIPAIGRGVGGAIPGSVPGRNVR